MPPPIRKLVDIFRRGAWDPLWAATIGLALAWVVLRYWEIPWGVPVAYDRDARFHLAMVQNLAETGRWLESARTGAPFRGSLADFPLGGERLHWLALWALVRMTGHAGATLDLWLLVSYPLVAAVAQPCARRFGLGRPASLLVAILFAFLPYHLSRGHGHFLRVAYFGVPVGALACWWAFARDGWTRRDIAVLLAIGVLVGSSDTQHAVFTCVLFGSSAVVVAVHRRRIQPLALALALAGTSGAALVANNAPYLIARARHGPNEVTAKRVVSEQERYGLRLAQVLLPASGHRIDAWSELKARSRRETLAPSEDGQSIGLLAGMGLLVSTIALLGRAVGRIRDGTDDPRLPRLGALNLIAIVFATGGGLGYLMSLGGLTMLRTWNRISVFIAWFSLIAFAHAVERLWRGRWTGARRVVLVGTTVVTLGTVGILDQTSPKRIGDRKRLAKRWHRDREAFSALELRLPPGAAVYQLPYTPFPEPPDHERMRGYAPLVGYLHTTSLRWSYGSVKGRPEGDWQRALEAMPASTQAAILAAAGFSAIMVDGYGYADRGKAMRRGLESFDLPSLPFADRRYRVYDLRPLAARQREDGVPAVDPAALAALVSPVQIRFGRGFHDEERRGNASWHWARDRATLHLRPTDAKPHAIGLRGKLLSAADQPATLRLRGGGLETELPFDRKTAWLDEVLLVPAEGLDLDLSFDGPPGPRSRDDPRELFFRIIDLSIDGGETFRRIDCWARARDRARDRCPTG